MIVVYSVNYSICLVLLLGLDFIPSSLFWSTFNLCSSLSINRHVAHPNSSFVYFNHLHRWWQGNTFWTDWWQIFI